MTQFQTGSSYSGFLLERIENNGEIGSTIYLFRHEILGTRAMAIKNDDPNKTFCVAFKTIPEDSTGVAHILEHSVLMGSRKYPVRDVFGEINKGGLMTFLNAMTGSDTTWYPFATRNIKEYFNIMDVYCDVVFHPLLDRSTFDQEGWHYHKEEGAPLQFQGVVLNEMKGAYSDPIRLIFHHTFKGLMPGSTYAHESGGDPQRIPDLTFDRFTDFHKKHYHPSNATFFFYGDADLTDELAFIQENYLKSYEQAGEQIVIDQGLERDKGVLVEDTYGVEEGSELVGKTFIAVAQAVGTVLDRKRNAAFQVIANILYNSDGSPLKREIVGNGLGKDFGGMFLDSSCYKTMMMTYLIGSDPDKRAAFEKTFHESLSEIVENGLGRDLVLSELNKYEFSVREEMCKAQRGLDLIGKALPALRHGTDPFEVFQIEEMFQEIRHQALEENYFEELIRHYLLDNPAPVVIILKPDPDKAVQTLHNEQERLDAYEQSLDEDGQKKLVERTSELIELQHTPNDEQTLALLPQLTRDDLTRRLDFHTVEVDTVAEREFLVSELDTNSICYVNLGFDCSGVPVELLPYLDLFGTIITEIGTKGRDYMQFAKEMNTCTGGFSHSFNTYTRLQDPETMRPLFWLHVKMLSGFLDRALDLVADVLSNVNFSDGKRIREIVQREFAWAEHAVQSEGYSLAASRVFAHLSRAGMYNEYVSGITQYQHLKQLAAGYEEQEEKFLDILKRLRKHLFQRRAVTFNITAGGDDVARFSSYAKRITGALGDNPLEPVSLEFPSFPASQAFVTAAEVVYNVQGGNLFNGGLKYNGHFEILKTWLSRDYLWNTVRQLGGAYGCFMQFNSITGNMGLVSYRDPQVAETYGAYDEIGGTIAKLDLFPQVLDQLMIGAFGSFNPHQGPAAKGATARNEYLFGITPEYKQRLLDEMLATTTQDLRAFAPAFEQLVGNSFRATIGNRAKIEADSGLFAEVIEI